MLPQTKFACDAYAHWLRARASAKVAQLMYDRNLAQVSGDGEVKAFVQYTNKMLKVYEEWEKNATETNLDEFIAALKDIIDEKDAA